MRHPVQTVKAKIMTTDNALKKDMKEQRPSSIMRLNIRKVSISKTSAVDLKAPIILQFQKKHKSHKGDLALI